MRKLPVLAVVLSLAAGCTTGRSTRLTVKNGYGEAAVTPSAYEAYVQGRRAAVEGRHEDAIAWFRQAESDAPDQPELPVAIAEELFANGQTAEARAQTDATLRRWPADGGVWLLRGRILAHAGELREAVASFEKAIRYSPDDERGYLMAAHGEGQLGRPRAAEDLLRQLVARLPDEAEGHFKLGQVLNTRGATREAEAELIQAVGIDSDHLDARIALADIYRRTNRAVLAARALRDAFDRSGEDPRVGRRLVVVLLEAGDREGALQLLTGLDSDWRSPRTRIDLAYFYLTIRRPEQAVRVADEVLARDPSYHHAAILKARALVQMLRRADALTVSLAVPTESSAYAEARNLAADLLRRDGKLPQALKLVDEALVTDPDSTPLSVTRANLLEQGGDPAAARKLLDDLIAKRPTDEDLLFARASLEDRIGDPERAVSYLAPLLAHDPDNVTALNFIGYSYATRGVKLGDAERMLRRAADLSPDDGYVLDSLGWVLFQAGRVEEAAQVLGRADRLSPDEPEILLHLGEVQLKRGDTGRALDLWHRALVLDPDARTKSRLEERTQTLEATRDRAH